MAKKQPGGVGRGRGIITGGSADRLGRVAQQGQRKIPRNHGILSKKRSK